MSIGQELLNVPMGDMIRQMAFAIAEGQMKLDASSIDVAEMMGGLKIVYDDDGKPTFDDSRIFFGYDLMTISQAEAYMAADVGLSGGDATAMIAKLRELDGVPSNATKSTTLIRVPTRVSMLELGFSPTFYQFVDTIIEVKIAIKITSSFDSTRTVRTSSQTNSKFSNSGGVFGAIFGGKKNEESTVSTSQVDATYSAKYSYSAEGSSLLRTKLVPLPPPPILEERIRRQLDEDVARRKRLLDAQLAPVPSPAPSPAPA
jgi:hypothetical protein